MELTSENSWSGRRCFVSAKDRSVYLKLKKSTNLQTKPAQYFGPTPVVFWMVKRWSQMGSTSRGIR